jgi:hypothetical protein
MGRAEDIFNAIQTDGLKAIDQFIADRKSEELFLDFKRSADDGNAKSLHQNDLNNYGKAISGFGNSSGGVIVWGIDCSALGDGADVARAKKPIHDPKRFLSWLENRTSGRTLPAHPGVIHHAIEIPLSSQGFIISLIPKSDWAPHQEINSRCYYMRVGSNFDPVPHGILEGFFGRRIQAKIVHKFLSKQVLPQGNGIIKVVFSIGLRNEGKGLGKYVFLTADISESPTTAEIKLATPSPQVWNCNFFLSRSFAATARDGVLLPPTASTAPLTVEMTLTPEIDRGISIQCCCGSENSQPIFFELGCSVDELRSYYKDILQKIQTSKLTDQLAYEATKKILGLDRKEAIGNII